MKWPKPVEAAIAFGLPMWWDAWNDGIYLRVQTGDTWNGKIISRRVWKMNDWVSIYQRSLLLIEAGANLDVSQIVRWPDRLDHWRFGWCEEASELRDQVWRAGQTVNHRRQPDWLGYQEWTRG